MSFGEAQVAQFWTMGSIQLQNVERQNILGFLVSKMSFFSHDKRQASKSAFRFSDMARPQFPSIPLAFQILYGTHIGHESV